MFDADRPITKSTQDHLSRSLFAKYLARCILDHEDPESLVIGLYGSWGVGKTSVINLVIEELNFAASNMLDEEKPIILNFSPWSYSGQHQLIYSFFRRLSAVLRNVAYLENADRIIYLLELYVSFFTHQPVPTSLRTKRSFLEKITFRKREDNYAWESGRDLTLVKGELNDLLRQQKHKIIIIIDNISRLYDDEIRQLFQIVKSMGDYVNTTYLLAFDKPQVIHALNRLHINGEAFLEKIVQLPFDIPPILQQDLENIFADRLNPVLKRVPEDTWNNEYWADIYYNALRFFFQNCRDITRYVNTLNFSYSRLRDLVNPMDFFALTAIEVFMPQVYAGIRDNKDLFTDLLDQVYTLDQVQIQKERIRCDEIFSRTDRVPPDVLLDLCLRLFPRLHYLYQPELNFYHSQDTARKLHRISSPDYFDIYFRLSMQVGQIPDAEFETIINQTANEQTFDQALNRLNQDDRATKFLDKLDGKILQTIPYPNIPIIINALFDNGDLFSQGIAGPLSLDTPMRIHRIIHTLLRRFETTDERFLLLQNAIAKANKSIYIAVYELKEQARQHLEELDTFLPIAFRDVTPDQLESLRKLAVSRIENWAETARLAAHPRLLSLLYTWRDWGSEATCRRFVEKMTNTDPGLLAFLTATLNEAIVQVMSEYHKDPAWEKYLENINAFIPAKSLIEHAKILFEDQYFEKLREKEQLALMIFLDLIKVDTKKIIPKTTV